MSSCASAICPVSKPLREWLAGLDDVAQIAIDPEGAWQDPASVLQQSRSRWTRGAR